MVLYVHIWDHMSLCIGEYTVDPRYNAPRYTAAVIVSSNTITYVLRRTDSYEIFWLNNETLSQHSLLQFVCVCVFG
jgi:hypothetical protein